MSPVSSRTRRHDSSISNRACSTGVCDSNGRVTVCGPNVTSRREGRRTSSHAMGTNRGRGLGGRSTPLTRTSSQIRFILSDSRISLIAAVVGDTCCSRQSAVSATDTLSHHNYPIEQLREGQQRESVRATPREMSAHYQRDVSHASRLQVAKTAQEEHRNLSLIHI